MDQIFFRMAFLLAIIYSLGATITLQRIDIKRKFQNKPISSHIIAKDPLPDLI